MPRGNGKSFISGYLAARALAPSDELFANGGEIVLIAASITQARIVYRFTRSLLEQQDNASDYKYVDNTLRVQIKHTPTNTRLIVMGSNAKTALGLVGVPLLIADEPSAWEVNNGERMHEAIQTSQGKPGSELLAVYIGTLAPSKHGWWHELVSEGSHDDCYVECLQADPAKWDDLSEIKRVNPLTKISPEFLDKLKLELKQAKHDTRKAAMFKSYRLNIPTADTSTMMLTVADWERACRRRVPPREGKYICGIDLGQGRAWSAAVALYQNGRCEAIAFAPGIPSIREQEKRDSVPSGTYSDLVSEGTLCPAHGKRVPPVQSLVDKVLSEWGQPARIVCDRFRVNELRDCEGLGCVIEPRVWRWSEPAEDIRALRNMAMDGPLAVLKASRGLLSASLSVAQVVNDDQGNFRLVKTGVRNAKARDDVAAALALAAGAVSRANREQKQNRRRLRVVS